MALIYGGRHYGEKCQIRERILNRITNKSVRSKYVAIVIKIDTKSNFNEHSHLNSMRNSISNKTIPTIHHDRHYGGSVEAQNQNEAYCVFVCVGAYWGLLPQ